MRRQFIIFRKVIEVASRRVGTEFQLGISIVRTARRWLLVWNLRLWLPTLQRLRHLVDYLLRLPWLRHLKRLCHRRVVRAVQLVVRGQGVRVELRGLHQRRFRVAFQRVHDVIVVVVILRFLEVLQLHGVVTLVRIIVALVLCLVCMHALVGHCLGSRYALEKQAVIGVLLRAYPRHNAYHTI